MPIFLIFAPKHRLWVLVRMAWACFHNEMPLGDGMVRFYVVVDRLGMTLMFDCRHKVMNRRNHHHQNHHDHHHDHHHHHRHHHHQVKSVNIKSM